MTNRFHLSPIEVLAKFNEFNLPKNFCIVPFTNIILNPGGAVSICRQKGTKHIVGHLKDNTIEEIWNNDFLKKWRSEFLAGEVSICAEEIKNDSCHLGSGSYFYIEKANLDVTQKKLPIKITANFNGKCNLKCKMCDVWTLQNGFYDSINFWEELEINFFPFIEEVELLSGEPFIQEDTWRLIDAVSKVNPNCIWSFTTNAHYELTDFMKSKLDKVIIKNIIMSVDSFVPERYQAIRLGGNLERVMTTLNQFKEYNLTRTKEQKIALNLHFLVMKDNYDEIYSVIELCEKNDFMLILNVMQEPVEDSILSFPNDKKQAILEDLLKHPHLHHLKRAARVLNSIIYTLPKVDQAYYFGQLAIKLKA